MGKVEAESRSLDSARDDGVRIPLNGATLCVGHSPWKLSERDDARHESAGGRLGPVVELPHTSQNKLYEHPARTNRYDSEDISPPRLAPKIRSRTWGTWPPARSRYRGRRRRCTH